MVWFWIWLAFIFLLLVLPLGYGWGYRGWGPPYPYYWRRAPVEARQEAGWGWAADVLWIVFVVAIVWLLIAVFR